MGRHSSATRFLLVCGAVAGPLFLSAALISGALRADYDPVRHPISSLALGEHGWTQTANFLLAGVLFLLYALGVRAALTPGRGRLGMPLLVAAWGIGLLGSGVFTTDPVSGYPPGSPDLLAETTTSGALHDASALPVFLGFPVLCLVAAWRFAGERRVGWTVYTLVSGTAFTAAFVLSGIAFGQAPGLVGVGGLLQRATVGIGLAWMASLAVDLSRGRRAGSPV